MSVERRLLSRPTNFGDAIALGAAVAAVVLAIIALAGIAQGTTAPLAAICVGVGLLGHGVLVTRRMFALGSPVAACEEESKVGEAAGDEVLGGAFAVALGVLALVGFAPLLLLGVAAITAGGALVFAAPSRPKLTHVEPERAVPEKRATVGRYMARRRTRKSSDRRKRAHAQRVKARMQGQTRRKLAATHDPEAGSSATTIAAASGSESEDDRERSKATPGRRRRGARTRQPDAPPKSLNEALAELPPKPAKARDSVEPLFEPEDLAAARANPAIIAAVSSHDAAPAADELPDASAKAVAVAVAPPPAIVPPSAEPLVTDATPELPRRERDSRIEPERQALADARELPHALEVVAKQPDERTPRDSRGDELAAEEERAREREAIEKAKELQHELQRHLLSHEREHEHADVQLRDEQAEHAHEQLRDEQAEHAADVHAATPDIEADVQKRRELPAVEPIPVSRETVRQHPGLYLGAAVWFVGGLASVVLGIIAVAGVGHAFTIVETAILVAGLSLVAGSIGKLGDAGRHAHDREPLAHG